jgi:hypothetical protein
VEDRGVGSAGRGDSKRLVKCNLQAEKLLVRLHGESLLESEAGMDLVPASSLPYLSTRFLHFALNHHKSLRPDAEDETRVTFV